MKVVYSGGVFTSEEVVRHLIFTGQSADIFNEIIAQKESMKKAEELDIKVTNEELQRFSDDFRIIRRLFSAKDMRGYLMNSGLKDSEFEAFCESSSMVLKIREALSTESDIRDYFFAHRPQFDRARVSVIVVDKENLAKELIMQVREGEQDFHSLASKYSVDEKTKYAGGYLGIITRDVFPPEVSAKVFNSSSGDLVGPFQKEDSFQLILIEEMIRAELNDDTKKIVKQKIFKEWIAQFQRGGIRIEI